MERLDKSDLVLGQDENVCHGTGKLVEKLKVYVLLLIDRLCRDQLVLETLSNCNSVVRLRSELSDRDFTLALLHDLGQKVLCLI